MNPDVPQRRWPGLLLSLFVPGFGLVRAGRLRRGAAWFLFLILQGVLSSLLAVWRAFPTWALIVVLVLGFGIFILMLIDSFRPGRLTAPMWAGFIILTLVLAFVPLPPSFVMHAFKIPTDAMYPTLQGASHGAGDQVIVNRLSYLFSAPARGDLAVFRTDGIPLIKVPTIYIKRIVGLPGEKIQIRDGHLFADGRQLGPHDGIPDFTYTNPLPSYGPANSSGIYEVPAGTYFMLGDNSANSFDSRYWGYLPRANLYGTVSRIYYPFSRMGIPP